MSGKRKRSTGEPSAGGDDSEDEPLGSAVDDAASFMACGGARVVSARPRRGKHGLYRGIFGFYLYGYHDLIEPDPPLGLVMVTEAATNGRAHACRQLGNAFRRGLARSEEEQRAGG